MKLLIIVAICFQTIAASLAVIFNAFLLYIMYKYTTNNFGFYKYILMSFSVFEIMFAIVVLLGEPIFFISQRTLIAFTYYGPIAKTPFAILGPTTYCFFYEIWLGFVVVHFLYRYISVCQKDLMDRISRSQSRQALLWFLVIFYILCCFFCAYFSCTRNKPTPALMQTIYSHFGVENGTNVANYVLRFTDATSHFSVLSTIAVLTHYVIICGSVIIVICCSIGLWGVIRDVRQLGLNHCLERQLFKSLLLQTTVPVLFSHFPSFIAMCFPLIGFDLDIFSFFSVFTTVPKALDPIILLMCIKCYRRGLAKILYAGAKVFASTSGSVRVVPVTPPQEPRKTPLET